MAAWSPTRLPSSVRRTSCWEIATDDRAARERARTNMSFHPTMDYGRGHHKSARALPEEGPVFEYTAQNRTRLEEICTRYPPERRQSAVLYALFIAQEQQGYLTLNAMRHVADVLRCTPAEVED